MSKHQKLFPLLFAGLGLWAFHGQVEAGTTEASYINTKKTLQKAMQAIMRQNRIVGLSIALVEDQKIVWAQGFGYANQAQQIKATPETIYRAGSISKLFTATAAMQLAEQSRWDIDQPLQDYVPNFTIKSRFLESGPITPRQLMTHHSGLPSEYGQGWNAIGGVAFNQLAGKLASEYAAYPPDFILSYSNLGFSLLGTAVENVCGSAFKVCLKNQVFEPLGMVDSEFATGASASNRQSQEYNQHGKAVAISTLRDVPAGGLNSTVLDLSRFIHMVFADGAFQGKQILAAKTLAEMLTPQNADIALDIQQRIGLAWFFEQTVTGENIVWHNGGLGGFHSYLGTIPAHKLGVVILTNSKGAEAVIDDIGKATLQLMLAEKAAQSGLVKAVYQEVKEFPSDESAYPGFYVTSGVGLLKIVGRTGHWRLVVNEQNIDLTLQTDGSMLLNSPLFGGEVTLSRKTLSGRQVLLAYSKTLAKSFLLGEKIDRPHLSKKWQQRVGTYQITNRNGDPKVPKTVQISMKNGFMVLSVAGFSEKILTPINDTEIIIAGLGRDFGDTLNFTSSNKGELLRYSGYVARKKVDTQTN